MEMVGVHKVAKKNSKCESEIHTYYISICFVAIIQKGLLGFNSNHHPDRPVILQVANYHTYVDHPLGARHIGRAASHCHRSRRRIGGDLAGVQISDQVWQGEGTNTVLSKAPRASAGSGCARLILGSAA